MKNVYAFSLLLAVLVAFWVAGCGESGGDPVDVVEHDDDMHSPDHGDQIAPDLGAYDAFVEEALYCNPNPIDFGLVAVGQSRTLDVVITNTQTAPITITDIHLDIDSEGFSLVDLAGGDPGVLNTSDGLALQVRFTPTASGRQTTSLQLVGLVNGKQQMWSFEVTGEGTTTFGELEVIPTVLDFGWVGSGTSKTTSVVLRNKGTGTVRILSVEFADTPVSDQVKFEITNSFPAEGPVITLQAEQYEAVFVEFTNNGPETGEYTADLVIKTDEPELLTVTVPITARSAPAGVCKMQAVPGGITFGTIAIGFPDSGLINLVNTGTGSCRVSDWKIADCAVGLDETVICPDPMEGTESTVFTFDGNKPSGLIGPGEQVGIKVTALIQSPDDVGAHSALASFKIVDVISGNSVFLPSCTAGGCEPNLGAIGGMADVRLLPASVDFGKVGLGCASNNVQVCVFNPTPGPLELMAITSEGCGLAGVTLSETPAVYPVSVVDGLPECFWVRYVPDDVGVNSCTIVIDVTDLETPQLSIPVSGEGVEVAPQVDDFVVTGDEPVDPGTGDVQFDLSRSVDVEDVAVAVDNGGDGVFVECESGWTVSGFMQVVMIDPDGACAIEPGDHVRVTYNVICLAI